MEKEIRKLARSNYWQAIYSSAKELGQVNLFNNYANFSGPQIRFLYWLEVYHTLYSDSSRKEDDFLSYQVIRDDDRCDAYLIKRKKKNEFEWKQYRDEERKRKVSSRHPKKNKKGDMIPIPVNLER